MPQFPQIPTLPPAPSRLDDPTNFVVKADAFLGALSSWGQLFNDWAAAVPSQVTGTDYTGTSSTSLAIGTGAKSFTSSTGRHWQIGQGVRIAYTVAPSNYMDGQVTAYDSVSGATTVSVTAVGGSGTQASWTLSLLPGSGTFASLTGVETLTNKTLTAPVIATIVNGAATLTLPTVTGTLATLANAETFTNKTLALGDNAISGTLAQFNAACTDAEFVSIAGEETLTNKTLTAPTIDGGTLSASVVVSDTGAIDPASVGFRGIPRSGNSTGTIVTTDNGKYVPVNTNIATAAIGAVPDGFTCEIVNESGSPITITSVDAMRWSGTATTGNRTLAAYGRAALGKRGAAYYVSGDVS